MSRLNALQGTQIWTSLLWKRYDAGGLTPPAVMASQWPFR